MVEARKVSNRIPDDTRGPLGLKLRALRRGKRFTQAELARRAAVGRVYVAELETGQHVNPSLAVIQRLADALEAPVEALIGR